MFARLGTNIRFLVAAYPFSEKGAVGLPAQSKTDFASGDQLSNQLLVVVFQELRPLRLL